ncbi:DUF1348 family protein [Ruegeria meonggei]|uniref:DUF1348 family protein n=1 Tax=Ruegeria meonggei TaxID=1446476 RepID=UPI0036727BD5
MTGDVAVTKIEEEYFGTTFADYLTLIKPEYRWQAGMKTCFGPANFSYLRDLSGISRRLDEVGFHALTSLKRSCCFLGDILIPDFETAQRMAKAHCDAWTERNPEAVASRYANDTTMGMNRGDPMTSQAEIAEMAAGFMADFPNLALKLDSVLVADHHMVYAWTFEGHHKETGSHVKFSGWEEWDLDDDLKVIKSLGWYDNADYERQVAGE